MQKVSEIPVDIIGLDSITIEQKLNTKRFTISGLSGVVATDGSAVKLYAQYTGLETPVLLTGDTYTSPEMAGGGLIVTVYAYAGANNEITDSVARPLVIDASAPVVDTFTLKSSTQNSATVEWTTSSTDINSFYLGIGVVDGNGTVANYVNYGMDGALRQYTYLSLSPNVTYRFKIWAKDLYGNESAEVFISEDFIIDTLGPDSTGVTATSTALSGQDGTLRVTWNAFPNTSEVSAYKAIASHPDLADQEFADVFVLVVGSDYFLDMTGLSNAYEYTVTLVAEDTSGNITTLDAGSARPYGPYTQAPVANVTGVSATNATVSWDPAAPDQTEKYKITYTPEGGSATDIDDVTSGHLITGLIPGTSYSFVVTAYTDGERVSSASAPVPVVTSNNPVGTITTGTITQTSVTFSWGDTFIGPDRIPQQYEVQILLDQTIVESSEPNYTLTSYNSSSTLVAGTTYTARVTALYPDGSSSTVDRGFATADAPDPPSTDTRTLTFSVTDIPYDAIADFTEFVVDGQPMTASDIELLANYQFVGGSLNTENLVDSSNSTRVYWEPAQLGDLFRITVPANAQTFTLTAIQPRRMPGLNVIENGQVIMTTAKGDDLTTMYQTYSFTLSAPTTELDESWWDPASENVRFWFFSDGVSPLYQFMKTDVLSGNNSLPGDLIYNIGAGWVYQDTRNDSILQTAGWTLATYPDPRDTNELRRLAVERLIQQYGGTFTGYESWLADPVLDESWWDPASGNVKYYLNSSNTDIAAFVFLKDTTFTGGTFLAGDGFYSQFPSPTSSWILYSPWESNPPTGWYSTQTKHPESWRQKMVSDAKTATSSTAFNGYESWL